MVEFKTPAKTNGFGTNSDFKKNAAPIYGFAMLLTSGDSSDISQAIVLRVRLQEGKDELASQIVQQSERELSQ